MLDVARQEHKRSRPSDMRLVTASERDFSLNDPKGLVFGVMDVRRGLTPGSCDLIYQCECTTRRIGGGLEPHETSDEPDALALVLGKMPAHQFGVLSAAYHFPPRARWWSRLSHRLVRLLTKIVSRLPIIVNRGSQAALSPHARGVATATAAGPAR